METLYEFDVDGLLFPSDEINFGLFNEIRVCLFQVNSDGKAPFLKYALVKNIFNKLMLPIVSIVDFNSQTMEFSNLLRMRIELTKMFTEQTQLDNLVVKGFRIFDDKLFVFADVTSCEIVVHDVIISHTEVLFALIDEIVHHTCLCNQQIDPFVSDFFSNHFYLCKLSLHGRPFEIPIVGYVKKPMDELNFTYIFGETAKHDLLGYFYYFDLFNNHSFAWLPFPPKYGIVRFALFTGNMDCFENNGLSVGNEHWAENSDSCFIEMPGNLNIVALKEHNQQVPLSYHYLCE
jgi:hypothetical protein